MMKKIPEEDLRLINDSFRKTGLVETLEKNGAGRRLALKKKVANKNTIAFIDFSGRILRHQKSIFVPGRGNIVIGTKGQRFDSIPLGSRTRVVWSKNDFEKINGG